jgi:hypothetical protein
VANQHDWRVAADSHPLHSRQHRVCHCGVCVLCAVMSDLVALLCVALPATKWVVGMPTPVW